MNENNVVINSNKIFNLYNATQHIIFSISFLENVIYSITDEKEINVYKSLIADLQYLGEKSCDLLELEIKRSGVGSIDSDNCTIGTLNSIPEDVSNEIRDYIKQIKEEIIREKGQL